MILGQSVFRTVFLPTIATCKYCLCFSFAELTFRHDSFSIFKDNKHIYMFCQLSVSICIFSSVPQNYYLTSCMQLYDTFKFYAYLSGLSLGTYSCYLAKKATACVVW
jgi:hypothetical protein